MKLDSVRPTETGGRDATTRHIPPVLALSVGMPMVAPPKHWQWAKLTNLARLESGHTPSRRHPEYWEGNIPWIGIQDAKANDRGVIQDTQQHTNELGISNSSARILPKHTVCLSRTASVGYVVVMGRPMATSQDFVNWVCSPQLDHNFLKYLLIAEGKDILRFASGSVHQTIYFPEVKAFYVCYPPLPEQRRIVGILDKAFAGIATAKANAEKNLQNARALFDSYLESVFTRRSVDWIETTLGKVCEFLGGSQPPKSVFSKTKKPDYIRLIQIRDYKSDKHVVYIPRAQARRFCSSDDVMIGRYGPPLFQILRGLDGAYNVALMKAVPNEAKLSRDFLFYFLKHPTILGYVIFHAQRAAGQIGVTKDTLEPYPIGVPTLAEQRRVVTTIAQIEIETKRLASIYERKLVALEALKKSLLHQAFTGQL